MATPYWEHRAALRQAAYDRANNKVVESVSRAYDRTMRQLDKDIDTIMATYTRKTGLSTREAYDFLRDGVPQSVMDDLRSRIAVISDPRQRKRLEVMLRTDAYRARISRLDAIKASTRVGLTEAAEAELGALEPHLRHTADLAYSRTMFDIQHATSIGFQGVGVPRRALDTILKSKWAGTHYSTSVWQNRDAMAGILDRALMEQASMGKLSDMTMQDVRGMVDLNKWRNQVKSKFKTEAQYQKYAANRLIRTESAYVAGQTTAVAYDECGIEKYEYIATLDSRTSEKCSGLDGKIFEMSEKEVGVNYPPAHPHCRSSVAPVIDGLTREGLTRAARDANGKTVYVPRDMKYQEWKAWQKDGAPADVKAWRKANAPKVAAKPITNPQIPLALTRKEADDVLGSMGITGMYDYAKVNVDIANAVNSEIAKMQELFGKNNVAVKFVTHKSQASAVSGTYSPTTGTMVLRNAGSKKALSLWAEDAKSEYSYGTWSTSDPLHAIRHELGHALHNGVGFAKSRPVLEPIYESWKAETGLSGQWDVIANRRAGRTDDELFKDMKKAGETLSAYGMTSIEEMVAESVAEYMNGKPRAFAVKVVHALMGW